MAVERNFEYRGDLRQTTLPEMLFAIYHHRVPGVFEATRQGTTKRIFVRSGNVIHAASTDRADSLGAFLRRSGKITPAAYSETMRDRGRSEQRYGALLIEKGFLDPAQVYQSICEQIESIVWSLFTWDEGEVVFRIAEWNDAELVRIHLPMRRVILEGIRQAPSARSLLLRVGPKETVLEPSFRLEDLIEIGVDAAELKLLEMVNGRRSLYEICTQGPLSPADNAKLLYSFMVLQLIKRSEGSGAIKIRLRTESDEQGS